MEALIRRGEELAHERQQQAVARVAQQLRALFNEGVVEAAEASVLVRGRGVIKRWLIDPSLRFLSGGLK